ncbi:hypothetical protein F511_11749 [Dorcoceras hygrometricum]|uniref:Uncharacterized protein n=1 Tax=Dorcoceras hygrometricum TaxID=472368 RepID=A0A2Z7BBZ6_9LAMI|nr:hypothetical protein F511_11749 [Dorcoceras hygrometricum]
MRNGASQISSWTRSSVSLEKLHGATKPSGDRTRLGYNSAEGSTTETSSTTMLERTKFKTMNFVKSSAGKPKEARSGDDMIVAKPPIWQGRFCGLGYFAPAKSREICQNKRIIQMRGKPKSGGINQGQFSRTPKKDRQYMPKYRRFRSNGTYATPQAPSRSKSTHGPHKYFDADTDKRVKSNCEFQKV